MTAWPASEFHQDTLPETASLHESLRALSIPIQRNSSGPVASFMISVFSFGLLPLWLWPRRWAAFADHDRQDVLSIAGWWRQRAGGKDLKRLDRAISKLRPQPILMILPTLAGAFIAIMIGWLIMDGRSIERLIKLTFDYQNAARELSFYPPIGVERNLHQVWFAGLMVAYILHTIAVRSHIQAVEDVTSAINRLVKGSNAPAIRSSNFSRGLNPLWIIAAVVFCVVQAWWGIPLVIGAAAQKRYYGSSANIRRTLMEQSQIAAGMMPAPIPTKPASARFCSGSRCGAKIPAVANFCPRCGTAV